MADSNKTDILKHFASNITTSKLRVRQQILGNLVPCVTKPDFPEQGMKGIMKLLLLTMGKYQDRKSRYAVEEVIRALAVAHSDKFLKIFTIVLSDFGQAQKQIFNPCKFSSGAALYVLGWSSVVARFAFKDVHTMTGKEFNNLVQLQSLLLYGTLGVNKENINMAAYNKITRIWKEVAGSLDMYVKALSDVEQNTELMCLISIIMQFLQRTKNHDSINSFKNGFIEQYVKLVIGSRVAPSGQILRCCQPLLCHVSHAEFQGIILPAVDKAMLRNPEIILESFVYLLAGLSIDLSPYATDITKHLATQLHSKEENVRALAALGCTHLAKQLSDPGAVSKVITHCFSVLNGSEGKLTITGQRLGLLTGIGNLSQNTVSGASSVQALATSVLEQFIPILQQEVHEGTLVHALSIMSLWCAKLHTEVSNKLTQWFKTGMGLKSSTSVVRHAYIQCMGVAYHGDRLMQGLEVLPLLIQVIEKAHNQPSNVQLVCEGLAAANLLIRLSLADIQAEGKLGPLWSILADSDKQLFTNEKFLSTSSDEALMNLSNLTERLVLDHPQKIPEKISRYYYQAFIYCLTHGSYQQRKHASNSLKKMLSALGGGKIAVPLLREFRNFLRSQKVSSDSTGCIENGDAGENKYVSPRLLTAALFSLTTVPNAELQEAESIALETLFDAHHPCIMCYNNSAWTDIVAQLKIDAAQFVTAHIEDITRDIRNREKVDESVVNTVQTIARIAGHSLPHFLDLIMLTLRNPALCTVTRTEYVIMTYPEGELYDKSVLEGVAAAGDNKIANVRRENKLYSYEEQMAELELKKELAKKHGKSTQEEPKLTKKQQEAKQNQLQKESDTRARCKQLDTSLENVCAILQAIILGNATGLVPHLPILLRYIVTLMKSPLAAPRVTQSFLQLRKVAFKDTDKYFGDLVAHTSLRLLKPECYLDKEWCEEPLQGQAKRALTMLYNRTAGKNGKPLPTFVYCFYLVKCLLQHGGESIGGDEQIMKYCLQIICAHAAMRKAPSNEQDEDDDDSQGDPELLPRLEMMELMLEMIGSGAGRMQQLASKALVDVAMCASGNEGCAEGQQEEIDVLLQGLQSSSTAVREASLMSLQAMMLVLPMPDTDYQNALSLMKRVWIAKFDLEEDNKKLADRLWEDMTFEMEGELCTALVQDTIHHQQAIREAAADALAAALQQHKDYTSATLYQLLQLYDDKLYMPPPVLDNFGRVISEAAVDEWPARSGIAMAICKMSALLEQDEISTLFKFFVEKGLGDRNEEVRKHMLKAAVAAVEEHGKNNVASLLGVFEEFLEQAPDTASFDSVRQSVVILMGSLAKHLDKEDPKVKPIVAKLIETLSTPSQPVQEAVANCLPPLVPAIKQDAPELVQKLLQLLLESDIYGERRGAAYGLAGLVKGLGILALKQLDIMSTLQDAIQNKKCPRYREGALFAFEMLCLMLGRLFEPYVVHILPHLLLCFGDNNQYVREAADDTAKAVMSKLSAHGVKLVLPSLLKALEEDSWRTKTGSVELLGAMAFCAPKQLSACLPSIVPKLMEVLNDSHLKVQKSGAQALKQIGSVIKNPEIQAIVPELLGALQDPTKKTTVCLQILLETKFVHFIDAPSLALIMPVVQRAFQDRSTETRKMAAQIIGNMYSLTDQKDLAPYLPNVIPGLKQSLLDPVPEVRSVSAKALGAMVKGMGENGFEDLLPWLMQTLTSEQSSVDRSGAAQGLSEVVGGLGTEKLAKLMPDIIATAERPDIAPHVRDGYIMMFIYLPTVFGDDFLPYLGPIIPPILQALADENEYVRETALKAGQRIVSLYAEKAIELLLPELERGLFDDNWRIRYSSVQLLGDLLYKISGVTGKMSTETASEDDNFGTETSQKAIMGALGSDRRNRVLAGLYMGRSDTALLVRQSALHVWKIIVAHTPKTLREILSTLFGLLLGCLASSSHDKRQVAARTLGDVVRKLGEKVLPEIIPILEKGLESDRSDQRQGVCIGLSEIMSSTSRDHVIVFADSLIPTVRKALCDPLPEVREAAARTFDNLHTNIGQRALDDILPALLKQLEDEETSEYALDGLKQVMAVKSRVVLPYLVPQLTSPPVNTRALSFLSSVAGEALTKHLNKILPALLTSLSEKMGTPDEQQELEYCQSVVLSVVDEVGVRVVMDELLAATGKESAGLRCAAVTILHCYCQLTKADYSEYVPQLFRGLLHLFTDTDERLLNAAWDCLNAVIKKLDASDILANVTNMRQALRFAISDFKGELLPGFCLAKKGIAPIWQIFREAILNGPPELKESAAIGLGEVIRRTSPEALKPSVVGITGPLIRILGDRFSFNVKVAVLETLGLLLAKCGAMLKPFLPQLQTTFVKALNDTNRAVRLRAAAALSKLIVIHTRVDPLFQELHLGVKNADDAAIRDTMLQALRGCITGAGSKMSDLIRRQIVSSLEGYLSASEDTTRTTAAACLGAFCTCMPPEELSSLLINHLLDTDQSQEWTLRHGRVVALYVALKEASDKLMSSELHDKVLKAIHIYTTADRIPLCLSGLRCIGFVFKYQIQNGQPLSPDLVQDLTKSMKHESNDVKQLVSQVVTYASKSSPQPLDWSVTKTLVPMLVMGTKEKNTAVRSYSESALVAVLKLRDGNEHLQNCLSNLEPGMRDSLNEVTNKALNKLASQADTEDDLDDTILV